MSSGRHRLAADPDPSITTIETHDHDGDVQHVIAPRDAPPPPEARLSFETLDSGDTNAFTSSEAGAVACRRDLHPLGQGQVGAIR